LGRLSLNPAVHVDPIGTIAFPLIAMVTGAPLIGWAKPVPVDFNHLKSPHRDFALIAAAGPASNLVLAVVGAVIVGLMPHAAPGDIVGRSLLSTPREFLMALIQINVLLAVFNMLPIPPLDGGNVLIGLLPRSAGKVIEQLRPYGFLILYALMLTGVLAAIARPVQFFIYDLLSFLI
jgi:Zn-dependent protease